MANFKKIAGEYEKNPGIQPSYHFLWFFIKNDNLGFKLKSFKISRKSAYWVDFRHQVWTESDCK